MEFRTRLIKERLIISFMRIAATVVASPLGSASKALNILNLQVAPIAAPYQVVAASHANTGFVTGLTVDSVTIPKSKTDTKFGQKLGVNSFESLESSTKLDADSELRYSVISGKVSNLTQVEQSPAVQNIAADLKGVEYKPNELDGTLNRQSVNTNLARNSMGYHNYALVCANSKTHSDYCASGRRGYYCSQNGYVMLQVVSHLDRP